MKFNEASTFKMGIDISHMQLELSTSENTNKPLELNQQATQPAVFMEYLFKNEKWSLNGGVRLVKPSGFNELYFQPQISASFRPLAGIEMKGSLARRVQNFNQFDFETILPKTSNILHQSKRFLPLQQSTSYMLGGRWTWAGFLFDMELWLNHATGSQLFTTLNTGNRSRATHAFLPIGFHRRDYHQGHRLYPCLQSRILQIFTGIYLK